MEKRTTHTAYTQCGISTALTIQLIAIHSYIGRQRQRKKDNEVKGTNDFINDDDDG